MAKRHREKKPNVNWVRFEKCSAVDVKQNVQKLKNWRKAFLSKNDKKKNRQKSNNLNRCNTNDLQRFAFHSWFGDRHCHAPHTPILTFILNNFTDMLHLIRTLESVWHSKLEIANHQTLLEAIKHNRRYLYDTHKTHTHNYRSICNKWLRLATK